MYNRNNKNLPEGNTIKNFSLQHLLIIITLVLASIMLVFLACLHLLKGDLLEASIDIVALVASILTIIIAFITQQNLKKDPIPNDEAKQFESNQELLKIVQNTLLEIYIVDFYSDQFLYANQGAIKALGYEEEELLATDIFSINKSLSKATLDELKKRMSEKENVVAIFQHQRKDKSTYGVQSFMHKVQYANKDAYILFDIQIAKTQLAKNELIKQKEHLAYQAQHDTLTHLPNRVLFYDRLEQAIAKAKRQKSKFALLFVDLDHFKEINDTYGHEAGDLVLIEVAKRLQACVRESDTVARLSGDEFVLLIEKFNTRANLSIVANKIVSSLSEHIDIQTKKLYVTCSVGISVYPYDADEPRILLKQADRAMYEAKKMGKNNFKFYTYINFS